MNKHHYKVIFSRVLNQPVVVSELAKAQGKAADENNQAVAEGQNSTALKFQNSTALTLSLKPLCFGLMLALGWVSLSESALAAPNPTANAVPNGAAEMAIRADKSAPSNQQATILHTANGLPQVNIQTPSAAGVSRNQYAQFDVAEKGAILNNARNAAQTQMAGWVQGNPNLARGEAKVILNEVNSANPSRLKGYVEVAGRKADVVIANPNGIACDGCGIINAGRATMTTGHAQIENGELKGFEVKGGKLSVGGNGLDNRQADYTDIIAERAQIDGGLWANKGIKITTGKNKVDKNNQSVVYVGDHANAPNSTALNPQNSTALNAEDAENPVYTVDVSRLGGMYAEKITLMDNGAGLGVRNAGHIGASAGNVQIDSQGRIVNEGTLSATQQVHLRAKGDIQNSGKIETKHGKIQLASQSNVEQHGSLIAQHAGVAIQAKAQIKQSGETAAKGNIEYQAKAISASKNARIAAGVNSVEQNGQTVRTLDATHPHGSDIRLNAEEKVISQGRHIASGKIKVEADEIKLDHSQSVGHDIAVNSKQANLNLNHAHIYATDKLDLATPNTLSTKASQLNANAIATNQQNLNNQGGTWVQRGTNELRLQADRIDNQAANIATQGRLSVNAQEINNRQGQLVSLGGQQIRAVNLFNSEGKMLSGAHQQIDVTQLENRRGAISAQGNQQIEVQQQIDNREGRINGMTSRIQVDSLDNRRQGLLLSSAGLVLHVTADLNNAQGMIKGTTNTDISAQSLNNENGLIYGDEGGRIEVNNEINNRDGGKIISLGKLSIKSEQFDNRGGVVQVAETLNLSMPTILNNKVGESGSFIQAGNVTIHTQNINNEDTKNSAENVITQGISANNLKLNAQAVNNTEGGIYVQNAGRLNVAQAFNNQKGEVLTWGNAEINGENLVINNDDGRLQASNILAMHARSIREDGHLEADKLRLTLQHDFNTKRDINAATEFTLNTAGNVRNNHKLSAAEQLTINAQNVDNQENGRLSSGETRVTAVGNVTNRGLINSFSDEDNSKTVIKAAHLDNLGSGRIYGDHVALQADKIENRDERDANGKVNSATIAGRQKVVLAGKAIINDTAIYEADKKGGTTIYSGGQIEFGEHLNAEDQAEGEAGVLRNQSAIIEAEDRIGLNHVKQTFNTNTHFSTALAEYPDEGNKNEVEYVMVGVNGTNFNAGGKVKMDRFDQRRTPGKNKAGVYDLVWNTHLERKLSDDELDAGYIPPANQNACAKSDPSLCYVKPSTVYDGNYGIWQRFGVDVPKDAPKVENLPSIRAEPTKPKALSKRQARNPARKAQYDEAMAKYTAEMAAYRQDIARYNEALKDYTDWADKNAEAFNELNQRIQASNGKLPDHYRDRWTMQVKEEKVIKTTVTQSLPGQILAGGDIELGDSYLENDKSTLIAGGLLHKANGELNNLDEKGIESRQLYGTAKWVHPRWRGKLKGWRWYGDNYNDVVKRREENKSFDMNLFTALTQANKQTANPFYTDQSEHKIKQHNGVELTDLTPMKVRYADKPAGLQQIDSRWDDRLEIRTIQPDSRLPTQSLYRINPTATGRPIIETDPAFTNKNRWLSSDYMFNQLRSDPQNMLKRLGDGYYEQRLVREQMNRLTGRHFSGNNRTFEEQYKALMDAGVTFAQKFNLTVGISLTPAQTAQLTSDIVWPEKQTVTLPSGKQVEALVPRVYAVVKKGDLDGNGTLISAEKLYVKGSEFINQGTIAGKDFADINTENLKNSGKLSGGVLNVTAAGQLENIGGTLEADRAMLLRAMGDFIHRSTTQTNEIKAHGLSRTETNLDRNALLYVRGENGVLSVSADNITLDGAQVLNEGKGLTLLDAKNGLNLTALSVGYDEKLGQSNSYRNANLQDVVTSSVKGRGDVQLQAKNIHTDGGELEAAQRLTLIAENDAVLGAADKTASLEQYAKTQSRGFLSSHSSERYTYDKLSAHEATRLQGKNIELSAKHEIRLQGTQAKATENLVATAGGEINVDTLMNRHASVNWEKHKKSGLSRAFSGGVAQIGYQRSKSDFDAKGYDETVIGSQLATEQGDLTLNSRKDIKVNASRLASGGDMMLSAKNVSFNAVLERHDDEIYRKQKASGLGLGFVYGPESRAKENYRQKEAQGSANTLVGKGLTAQEAVSDAAESTARGLQPYLRHNQYQSHKFTQKAEAKISELDAGGKLSMQAREGNILSQGGRISAEGDAQFIAKNNVEFGTATHTQGQQANSRQKGFSADGLNKYVAGVHLQHENGNTAMTQETGGSLSIGGNSTTIAEQGDIILKGTALVAQGHNRLQANEGNITLLTAETRDDSRQARKGHAIGEAVISDTERFFGYNRTRMNQSGERVVHQGSQLTSLNDSIEVYAGKNYRQTASDVLAKDRVNINAQNITMNNAFNHQADSQSESDLKIGQFARVKSPIIDLLNTIESAVKNKKASDRLNAANAMSIAAQGYNVYDLVSRNLKGNPKDSTYLLRIESGSGVAHSRQSQAGLADISMGNHINAKDIALIARGDDAQKTNEKGEQKLGDINLTHTDLTSRDAHGHRIEGSQINLTGHELNILAGESRTQFKARNQSVGVEVGVAATLGAQTGVGVYARVGASSGKEDGKSKTYQASHLDADTVSLTGQGNTNLIGSQIKGNTIKTNVGGKLNIESLQDEEHFKTKSSGGGLEVEFGFGNNWSVSGYGNASSGKTSRKQVKEQAGIFAEEGGYHINADSVHLKGGAIASTNPTNSKLATNKLTFEDIQNESSSKAASASISGNLKESKEKWVDNETGRAVKPNAENSTKLDSQRSGGISPGLPMFERDSDSSVTRATLTEGTIILNKDTNPTITTAKELGINTDLAKANEQVAQTKDVKAILAEHQQIAAAVGQVKSAVDTYTDNLYEEAKQQEREAKIAFEQGKISAEKYREAVVNTENWEMGGKYKQATDAITAVMTLAVAGKPTETVVTAGLSPYLNSAIKEITKDIPELNIPAHMIWGAVESQLMGGDALSGALSVGAGEAAAHYLAKEVYQKDVRELSEDEKRNISALSQLTAAITSGLTSAVGNENATTIVSNLSIDTVTTKNAVENNFVKAAVTGAKVIYKAAKARIKNGRLSAADLKQTLKEEGLDIADNLYTLFDGELSWDDALAVIDLVVGTEFNTANKGKAAERLEELNDEISKRLIKKEKGDTYRGGPHSETKSPTNDGLDSHHCPAKDCYKKSLISSEDGPAIKMDPEDHKLTASYGRSKEAERYRAKQKELLDEGKLEEAINMDVMDIRQKFGNKYDNAIEEMLEYAKKLNPNDFKNKRE